MALRRTAVEKANAADPSVKDPPQAPATLDQGSPSATAAAERRSSLDHPPRNRRTSSLLCSLKQKFRTFTAHRSRGYLHRPPEPRKNEDQTPVQALHAGSTHLHSLAAGTGVKHHEGEKETEKTLLLDEDAAVASTTPRETEDIFAVGAEKCETGYGPTDFSASNFRVERALSDIWALKDIFSHFLV